MADLYAAAPKELAANSGLHVERIAGATLLLAPGMPDVMFNRVIGLGTFEPATEAVMDAVVERYRAAGVAQFWVSVSPTARPADLAQSLQARGFVPPRRRSWAQMWWRAAPPPAVASSLEVREARRDEAETLGTAIASAFGMPSAMSSWFATLVGRHGWQGFLALDAGTIAGGALLFSTGSTAWLGMGSILPGHRGRNGQLALMSARIRHAQERGCTAIHTETGEPIAGEPNPSLANMVRCGFERIGSRLNFAMAPAPAAPA